MAQYKALTHMPRITKGDIVDLPADSQQTQERLKRGFIEPFNPVKETQDAKPVKETKRRRKQSDE